MARTTPDDVKALIQVDTSISLTPIIRTANVLTTQLAGDDSDSELSTAMLREIETLLACHFYALRDPQYQSERVGDASAEYHLAKPKEGLEATVWGQQAVALDVTGYLSGHKVRLHWLGLAPSEQTDYEDRD